MNGGKLVKSYQDQRKGNFIKVYEYAGRFYVQAYKRFSGVGIIKIASCEKDFWTLEDAKQYAQQLKRGL
jgi:hypothetical protein